MIKFIYFDVGGVVVLDLIDNEKWNTMKRDLGVAPEQDEEFERFYLKLEREVCVGRDAETLVPLMKEQFGLSFPENYSLVEDFAQRFEKNESIWPIVQYARDHYRIGLLTNTYPKLHNTLISKGFFPDITWDILIDSSKEGLRKPDPAIFKLAEERAGVTGEEILFIDNSEKHLKSAQTLGWQTFHYDPRRKEQANEELMEKILKV